MHSLEKEIVILCGLCLLVLPRIQRCIKIRDTGEILAEKLEAFMEIQQVSYFQYDGTPCHTSKGAKKWLADHAIEVIGPWPGSSPDLNPIKNLRNFMKQNIANHYPTSLENLKEVTVNVWVNEITRDYCKKLARSMPKRISAVLRAKGQPSKY